VSGSEAAFGDGMSERGETMSGDPAVGDRSADGVAGRLRALPQVQRLLEQPEAVRLARASSRATVAAAFRTVLDRVRSELRSGDVETPTVADLVDRAEALITADRLPGLRRVINATGVIIHTNLGRAPLAAEAVAAAAVAQSYCNLEFDLETGGRGARAQAVESLLFELTGAEAALVVNNAAAAVLLGLSALAGGGEVIVSRGELVEIGGGFRIPDVIRQGGAQLVEVGTTNKTRIEDYAAAVTPDTRVLLKVHQSNYRIIGFTEETQLEALAELARARDLILMHDLGGGALIDLQGLGRMHEPTVQDCLKAGADIVAFSGDKLMGGPQAGLLVGAERAIAPLRRHPLMRALRVDKMSLAALEATLRLYRDPEMAIRRIPALRMLAQTDAALHARAQRLAQLLDGTAEVKVEASQGYAGGGALPEQRLASWAVTLSVGKLAHGELAPDALAAQLRAGRPGVVGRVGGGALILDMLTVADEDVIELAAAVRAALV
jgi:L-seryl-tRNA(Ser) seleniumtransferase